MSLEELGIWWVQSGLIVMVTCFWSECCGSKQCRPEQPAVPKHWKKKQGTNWKSLLLAFFSPSLHFPSLFCSVHELGFLKLL